MKPLPPLDIEAIRVRLASANPFGVPRWVASDVGHLLAEVVKLRADVAARDERARGVMSEANRQKRLAEEAHQRCEAERADVVTWLRAFAAVKASGPVSPVRRIEQTFASRAADTIERGEHVPAPTPPATASEESGEA
jgi:hypothetical protein